MTDRPASSAAAKAGRPAPAGDNAPITAQQVAALFAPWKSLPKIVLAVSGGPDSVALMWLAARWRRGLKHGPEPYVVTVDHGLRAESAREARGVKRLAGQLGLSHRTLRWRGDKPTTGLQAAARAARYALLAQAAKRLGATHVMTAHTRDDQAETVLMRLSRGSGLSGLKAMASETERDGVVLLRPLLSIAKAQLITTLDAAGIDYARDPSNTDARFARPRLRELMPRLAAEGCDASNLARLAARAARADAALDLMTEAAERDLAVPAQPSTGAAYAVAGFVALPAEIRVRLLLRALGRVGHEGPPELGKVEALETALLAASQEPQGARFKRTLAGAAISLGKGRLIIAPAPQRRTKS